MIAAAPEMRRLPLAHVSVRLMVADGALIVATRWLHDITSQTQLTILARLATPPSVSLPSGGIPDAHLVLLTADLMTRVDWSRGRPCRLEADDGWAELGMQLNGAVGGVPLVWSVDRPPVWDVAIVAPGWVDPCTLMTTAGAFVERVHGSAGWLAARNLAAAPVREWDAHQLVEAAEPFTQAYRAILAGRETLLREVEFDAYYAMLASRLAACPLEPTSSRRPAPPSRLAAARPL